MRASSTSFPRLTWVRCECGCGWEGEDEVTQFLVEEAAFAALDLHELAEQQKQMADQARHEHLLELARTAGKRA